MLLLDRRSLLLGASLVAAPAPAWARNLSQGAFSHGVASGDPLADGVIIWTRFAHAGEGRIGWEVSEDENFSRVAAHGQARARFAYDFCVKADVRGLIPGRRYFYRFLSASGPSPTGLTRTAPQGGVASLTVALFSCANLPYGYFHAYGHAAAREDVDLALHVGDYIYEIQRGAYPSQAEAVPGRSIDPVGETVSLSDYYQRYGSYHSDPDLLELRRLKPMSVVWDDHEIANDTWREGAAAHDPSTEGSFANRIAAASKAYFDWMPIRRPEPAGPRLYRGFDWGDLARILLLDTRFIGRDRQLDYRATIQTRLAEPGADVRALAAEFRPLLDNPARGMLGASQEAWLANALSASKQRGQTWQIIAQQVQIGAQVAPLGLSRLIGEQISAGGRAWFENAEQLTPLGLPWNLDTWNGYPAARARLLEACATQANNTLALGGDSHNCWVNNLPAASGGRLAAIEFAGGSVTSPGFERTLTRAGAGEREQALRSANPGLIWCDLTNRGYGAMRLTREGCAADWIAFADVRAPMPGAANVTRISSAASASAGPGPWTVSG